MNTGRANDKLPVAGEFPISALITAIISPDLKCYLVARKQNQPQDVSAGSIKSDWDQTTAKWAKNFQRWRSAGFRVVELEHLLNHTSDPDESVLLIYTYAEFRAHSK